MKLVKMKVAERACPDPARQLMIHGLEMKKCANFYCRLMTVLPVIYFMT
jgi:hypothetical protein